MSAAILFLLALAPAHAAGVSADIELIRPTLAKDALPGIDSPVLEEPGTVRMGGMIQQVVDPLVLYEKGQELGTVVSNRTTLNLAVAWDFAKVAGFRLTLPVAVQYGTDIPELARDGAVFGDMMAGVRLNLFRRDYFELGLRGDLGVPSGTRGAWMGEAGFRGQFGTLAIGRIGDFDVLNELTFVGRPLIPTGLDFTLGNELLFGLGGRYHLWRDRASFSMVWAGRGGLGSFAEKGAENPSELLAVTQFLPRQDFQIDVGVGKGLADGYGTSAFRAFLGLTWVARPKEPEPPPPLIVPEIPPPVDKPIIEPDPEPEPEWEEEELARIDGERIVIRDPIEFEFNTRNILPQSLPTLRYVATLMNENWQLGHLVIEGHASEEGTFIYNYDLSLRRATAIWEELIRAGVHPDRMSIRGMGEVVPRTIGEDEASLADNRRVEFKIVRQYRPDEDPEVLRDGARLPWNGDDAEVGTPEKPPEASRPRPKPVPTSGTELEDFFDEMDDPDADPPDETTPDRDGE